MPLATTRNNPASAPISGNGNSRNSVVRGAVITAAKPVALLIFAFRLRQAV
jgi:hypothetical protein